MGVAALNPCGVVEMKAFSLRHAHAASVHGVPQSVAPSPFPKPARIIASQAQA